MGMERTFDLRLNKTKASTYLIMAVGSNLVGMAATLLNFVKKKTEG